MMFNISGKTFFHAVFHCKNMMTFQMFEIFWDIRRKREEITLFEAQDMM